MLRLSERMGASLSCYKAELDCCLERSQHYSQTSIRSNILSCSSTRNAKMQLTVLASLLASVAMTASAAPSTGIEARQGVPRVRATCK